MTDPELNLELEELPDDDQMERMEDLLTELTILTRRYKIALITTPDGLMFYDLSAQRVIGIDLVIHTKTDRPTVIDRYDARDSILDGVWLVRGPDGHLLEQHVLRSPWPRRDA